MVQLAQRCRLSALFTFMSLHRQPPAPSALLSSVTAGSAQGPALAHICSAILYSLVQEFRKLAVRLAFPSAAALRACCRHCHCCCCLCFTILRPLVLLSLLAAASICYICLPRCLPIIRSCCCRSLRLGALAHCRRRRLLCPHFCRSFCGRLWVRPRTQPPVTDCQHDFGHKAVAPGGPAARTLRQLAAAGQVIKQRLGVGICNRELAARVSKGCSLMRRYNIHQLRPAAALLLSHPPLPAATAAHLWRRPRPAATPAPHAGCPPALCCVPAQRLWPLPPHPGCRIQRPPPPPACCCWSPVWHTAGTGASVG